MAPNKKATPKTVETRTPNKPGCRANVDALKYVAMKKPGRRAVYGAGLRLSEASVHHPKVSP